MENLKNIMWLDVSQSGFNSIKTIYKFNAVNLTFRTSVYKNFTRCGPNSEMLGKNKSDPSSFIAMNFVENLDNMKPKKV